MQFTNRSQLRLTAFLGSTLESFIKPAGIQMLGSSGRLNPFDLCRANHYSQKSRESERAICLK